MDDVSLIEHGFEEFPATIALLDSRDDIAYTNRSWRALVDVNDYAGDPDLTGIGYLAVCDATRGTGEVTGVVADGIRTALRGDRGLFIAEYPCHSLAIYRRFALRVIPIDMLRHGSSALASHFNITDRRLAELRVNEKNEHLAALVSVLVSELKAQFTSATTFAEQLTTVDGDAAVTFSKSPPRIGPLVEWGTTVAGQPSILDLGAVEFRPHIAQARALASPDGADDALFRVVGDGSLSADTHLFGLLLVAVLMNCYERNVSSGSSSSATIGTTADGFYVDDNGPRPSPEELAVVTADPNQLLGVDYGATYLLMARRVADLHGWQFGVGDSELGGARFEVRGVDRD